MAEGWARARTRAFSGPERHYLEARHQVLGSALGAKGLALALMALPLGFLAFNGSSWRAFDQQSLAGLAAALILSLLVGGILTYGPGASRGPAGWRELRLHRALGEDLQGGRLHHREGQVERRWTEVPRRGQGKTRYFARFGPAWQAELHGPTWLGLHEGQAVEAWLAPASGEVVELNGQAHRLPLAAEVVGPPEGFDPTLPPAA